jgi:predicted phage terminase large subunit-like protein
VIQLADLEGLTAEQLEVRLAAEAAQRVRAKQSLQIFAARMREDYVAYAHSKVIIRYLEALERRDIENLVIAMPPQHGKSFHGSELLPAWYMGRNPKRNVVLTSYGDARAYKASREIRSLIADPRWPFEARLAPGAQSIQEWALTTGGYLRAAGAGSALGGFGGHLLVLDDPFKDRVEADSIVIRDRRWDWFTDVFMLRKRRHSVKLIITTLWNDDDVVGRLRNSEFGAQWEVLLLPGYADPAIVDPDPLGRSKGVALWPEGPDLPSPQRGEISSRSFQALIQCDPSPATGDVFKAEWFKRRYRSLDQIVDRMQTVTAALDGAWKEGVSNDDSAIALWGSDGVDFYLLHAWSDRVEYPMLKQIVRDYGRDMQPDEFAVEDAASGIAIVQELRRETDLPLLGVPTRGMSKLARAEAISPLFEAGKVVLPERAPWLDGWIKQHLRFPNGKRDDLVDTTSLALARLSPRNARAWGTIDPSKSKRRS